MQTAKHAAQAMIADLPDDASYDDIQYHLYVQQLIEERLASVDRGEVKTHAEVKEKLARWRER